MRRIRSHLTYSNVMVTILTFIVLGEAPPSPWAATTPSSPTTSVREPR